MKSQNAEHVAVPIFDRQLEIARAGARLIPKATRIIVVEGNYLLLRREPWSDLLQLFDLTVLIETPNDVLRERLSARWRAYNLTPDQIAEIDKMINKPLRLGSRCVVVMREKRNAEKCVVVLRSAIVEIIGGSICGA